MCMAPRLPELQEHLDSALKDAQGGIVGVTVQGSELDSIILVDPLQFNGFYDSMTARTRAPQKQRQTLSLQENHTGDCLPSPGAAVFHCATTSAQKTGFQPIAKNGKGVSCTSSSLFLTPDSANLRPYTEQAAIPSSQLLSHNAIIVLAVSSLKLEPTKYPEPGTGPLLAILSQLLDIDYQRLYLIVPNFDKEKIAQNKGGNQKRQSLFTGTLKVNPNQSFCCLGMYQPERLPSLQGYCAGGNGRNTQSASLFSSCSSQGLHPELNLQYETDRSHHSKDIWKEPLSMAQVFYWNLTCIDASGSIVPESADGIGLNYAFLQIYLEMRTQSVAAGQIFIICKQAEKDVAELELWEVVPSGKTEPVLQQLYTTPFLAGKPSVSQFGAAVKWKSLEEISGPTAAPMNQDLLIIPYYKPSRFDLTTGLLKVQT
ncbi:hypothetical protein DUI87_20119 [Hirundo rustica rustica]|uniref:Uncharacterized protein n=1 Tax=Hirundo rustica rustica TaxID=333673 RepID=A0A3M0JPL1_HIRRU|nr:hypothetical protein DUI87_20119 [Hirundo rustica rustica]